MSVAWAQQAPTVSFARGELGCVPESERSRWFREEDRRWVPDRTITDQVMIGEPSGVVDLVTIRHRTNPATASSRQACWLGICGREGRCCSSSRRRRPPPTCSSWAVQGRLFCSRAGRTNVDVARSPDAVMTCDWTAWRSASCSRIW